MSQPVFLGQFTREGYAAPSEASGSFLHPVSSNMSRGCVALLVVMAVVAGLWQGPTPVQGLDISNILSSVADTVIERMYVDREITLMDHYCTLIRRPHFYRWELKWRAAVTCPGWTPISGTAKNYANPNSAEREATRDFVKKAVERGLVTREEAKEWL